MKFKLPFKLPLPNNATAEEPVQPKTLSPPEVLAQGMINVRDIIAPSAIEVDFNHMKIGSTFYRTLSIFAYPRFVGANWLSSVINFDHTLDISMFYYPVKSKGILDDLRRKITEMEATMMGDSEKGKLVDPQVKIALEDAKLLQEQLVAGIEKFFQFSFYITIPADSLEELNNVTKKIEATLGSLRLLSKTATLQMEEAFQSTIPVASDKLLITRNMDTTSLATTFPFTSSDLTSEDGIMYGINMHNGSLVIFDRFSLENANTVVFAKSGSGKSFFVKLEALRMMVFGAELMVIDPEEEYKVMCEAVGGNYIGFSPNSPSKINPFDLAGISSAEENELGQKLQSLHTLLNLMLGKLNPTEEAVMDKALIETYRLKGITPDPATQITKEPPVMEDLYKVLLGMPEPEAKSMSDRLEKYIRGSMAGIFDSQSTIKFNSKMTVFSTKNLEENLRPVAFYIILDFVWTTIKKNLKKRVLIVEEAWYLLQNEDSARFIYGIAKRARKYYLGLTTVTQDVEDFLKSEYGKPIVSNSSIQMLLKQHPAAIDKVAETFYLSEGEKRMLLAADVGEGLFFAGTNHIALKVQSSPEEYKLINTNPEELLKLKNERAKNQNAGTTTGVESRPVYKPIEQFDPNSYTTLNNPPEAVNTEDYKNINQSPPKPSEEALKKARANIEAGILNVNVLPNMPKHEFPEEVNAVNMNNPQQEARAPLPNLLENNEKTESIKFQHSNAPQQGAISLVNNNLNTNNQNQTQQVPAPFPLPPAQNPTPTANTATPNPYANQNPNPNQNGGTDKVNTPQDLT